MTQRVIAVVAALGFLSAACSGETPNVIPIGTSTPVASTTEAPSASPLTTVVAPTTTAFATTPTSAIETGECTGLAVASAGDFVVLQRETDQGPRTYALCDTTNGEETELPRESRTIRCEGDMVIVRNFVYPESLNDPFIRWTESRGDSVVDGAPLHLRHDYKAAAELTANSCGDWHGEGPFFRAAVQLLNLMFQEIGFTYVGGDHAIDPTWAAEGTFAGELYSVHIDIDFQDNYVVQPDDWVADCAIGRLAFSPSPAPALLPHLADVAGCEI